MNHHEYIPITESEALELIAIHCNHQYHHKCYKQAIEEFMGSLSVLRESGILR